MKIISGGQTGVDRAALDTARLFGWRYGGWVPDKFAAEDGRIPSYFSLLVESGSEDPDVRTRLNVGSADATLIITRGDDSPGTRLTEKLAKEIGKPVLVVDLALTSADRAVEDIRNWLALVDPLVLNVAGPRASEVASIYEQSRSLLEEAFKRPNSGIEATDRAYENIRHWDNIRWIVPFWFFSFAAAAYGFLMAEGKHHRLIAGVVLLTGLGCAFLIGNTMKYHNQQVAWIEKHIGKSALDPLGDIRFEFWKPWKRATQVFFLAIVLVSLFSLLVTIIGNLETALGLLKDWIS